MKKWFENLAYKTQQWMQGRYGTDELTKALYILSLAFFILSLFHPIRFFSIPAILLMLWSCIRCYSKNFVRRWKERENYLKLTGGVRSWFRLQKSRWKDRKEYRYYRCRECKAPLRVPKGKGNIRIRCPKCRYEMQAKS